MPQLIPAAVSGGLSLFGALKGNSDAKNALALQKSVFNKQSNMADTITRFAQNQHSMADPAISKAMSYYTSLASGNRGALNAAMAPEMASMTDTYRGATTALNKIAPGAQRDKALSDLIRQRAGQAGMMPMQARAGAVGQLGGLGTSVNNSANGLLGSASGIFSGMGSLANSMNQTQQQINQGWQSFGSNIGTTFLPMILNSLKGGGGGSSYAGNAISGVENSIFKNS